MKQWSKSEGYRDIERSARILGGLDTFGIEQPTFQLEKRMLTAYEEILIPES